MVLLPLEYPLALAAGPPVLLALLRAKRARGETFALAALAATPERFALIGTFPRADGQGEVGLYAVRPPPTAPQDPTEAIRALAHRPGG